jgi:hypothetical protein
MSSPDSQPDHYQICIQGYIAPCWSDWLGCNKFTHTTKGETILSCQVIDQAALHGLLAKIRDMNLKILSVNRVRPMPTDDKGQHGQDQ